MSLESRRKSFEGLNDYDEKNGEETNERLWASLGKSTTFDPNIANKRAEERKRQTLEDLKKVTDNTTQNDEESARQAVLNSYSERQKTTNPNESDYSKTGVGSFADLMTQLGKEQYSRQQDEAQTSKEALTEDWLEKVDRPEIVENLLSENYYEYFSKEGTAYQDLPTKIQGRIHEKNVGFINAIIKPISQHERISLEDRQAIINGVHRLQEYSSSCHDSVSSIISLQKIPIPTRIKDSERLARGTEGFAQQIARLNFEDYVKDNSFEFNVDAFFSKNDQDVSTIDILTQTGNIDGLTALHSLGDLMQQNRLLQPRTKQAQYWNGETHHYREEDSKIDTSQEGNKLLDGLKSTVLYSLDIVSDGNFDKLMGFVEEKLKDETDVLEFIDAANRVTDSDRKKRLKDLIDQKVEENGHSMRKDGKIDVARYYYPSLEL